MALYAMGDLHLSLNSNKSMEVFGPAWENYTERIRASLSQLTAEDVLVLAGDTSWGMSLEEAAEDFRFLEQFPCKKLSHQRKSRLLVVHCGQVAGSSAKSRALQRWSCCITTAFSTATMPFAAPAAGFWRRSRSPITPRC